MRELRDSDLFMKYINHDNVIFGRIGKILSGAESTLVVLNEMLADEIQRKIVENKREKTVSDMGYAINNGDILLITMDPSKKLPDMVPFFIGRNENTGKSFAFVNMSPIVRPVKNADGSLTYELGDANKAYTTIYSAYLALKKFNRRTALSSNTLYNAAVLWADMFNKPLYDAFGMSNPERNDALMYFSMKFFLRYIMECDEGNTESISSKYIKGKKNDLILYMDEKIHDLGLNMYEGLIPYMKILFNNEVTQAKGVRVANISNSMNEAYYIQKFTTTYSSNALLGLCTFPYFTYVIVSAMGKSKMVRDKSFDRIFQNHQKEVNAFLISLMRD